MTTQSPIPTDPDLRGVPDALMRAAENARRLAEQTGTPWIVRNPPEERRMPDLEDSPPANSSAVRAVRELSP